jgi:hypothetical protein
MKKEKVEVHKNKKNNFIKECKKEWVKPEIRDVSRSVMAQPYIRFT